jgi:hypothetical protein
MKPNQLAIDLEGATNELLQASEIDLYRVHEILARRAAVLARIAAADAGSFTPAELASFRTALRKGESIMENLTLLRRATAIEWQRLNRLKTSSLAMGSTISVTL